jgi:hypothetical protein
MFDLDRYYTPDDVADRLLDHVDAANLECCVDSACGDGSLLLAAKRAFRSVRCTGIDKDRAAIRRLRRRHPDWHLSVGDVLDPRIHTRSSTLGGDSACDLLALNPPFSLGRTKSVPIEFRGESLRSSVAMAHVLRSTDLFVPAHGAVAIVPESLLHSDVDEVARRHLRKAYDVRVVAELTNTTFGGARANAVIVRLTAASRHTRRTGVVAPVLRGVTLVRGGLPVFEARRSSAGLPFLHSTDIITTVATGSAQHCQRVEPIERGRVAGVVILLPRVGVPSKAACIPVYLRSTVQLSDCVFALRFETMAAGLEFAKRLLTRWTGLIKLYRGTGARYVTKNRLDAWLATV